MKILLRLLLLLVLLPWGTAEDKRIQIFLSKPFCLYLLQDDESCSSSSSCLLKNTTIEIKCRDILLRRIAISSLRLTPGNETRSTKPEYEYKDIRLEIKLSNSPDSYEVADFSIHNLENPCLQSVIRKIFAHLLADKAFTQIEKPIPLMGKYRPFSPPSYSRILSVNQFDVTQVKDIEWKSDEKKGINIGITWDIWNVSWREKSQEMTIYSYPDEKLKMHITPDEEGRLTLDFSPVSRNSEEINQKIVEYLKKEYSKRDFFDPKELLDSAIFRQIFPTAVASISPDGQYCIVQNTPDPIERDLSQLDGKDFAIIVQSGAVQRVLQKIQPDPVLSFLAVAQKIEPEERAPNCLRLKIPREILGKPEKNAHLTLDLFYSSEQEKMDFKKFCDTTGITCNFQNNRIFLGGEVLLFLDKKPLAKIKDIECCAQIKYSAESKKFFFVPERYEEPQIDFFYPADKLEKNYERIQKFCATVWEIFSWALEKSNLALIERFWKDIIQYANVYTRKIEVSHYDMMTLDGYFVLYGNIKK